MQVGILPENGVGAGREAPPVKPLSLFKNHAHVVQTGNEAAAVYFAAAGCAVTKPDDVGAVLEKTSGDGQSLGVVA